MQFPKAKRFASPTIDDIPPVGAYSIGAPLEPNYKRGPLNLTDKRFHDPNILLQPDAFGLYDLADKENNMLKKQRSSNALGGNGNGLERMKQQMEDLKTRMSNQHEKDLAKLQNKITRLETSREEGVKERQEMSKELLGLKSDLRSTTTREQSLAGKLAKAEASLSKYQALLPTLQTKLDQLTTSHTDSRKRKDLEIEELNQKLGKKAGEVVELKEELKELKRILREEKWAREELTKVGEKTVKEVREQLKMSALERRLNDGRVIARLEANLQERTQQLQEATESTHDSKEHLVVVEALLLEAQSALEAVMEERALDREEKRAEKDWRQRARSDLRDATGLRDDVKYLEQCVELDRERAETSTWLHETRIVDLQSQIAEHEKELEVVEGELDLAINEEIPRLEDALDAVTESLDEMQDRFIELQEVVEGKEEEVKELQTRAIAETERFEGSMEEEQRKYADKVKEVEKERNEKRKIASLLGQARSAEQALTEERDQLLSELLQAEDIRTTHENLVANLDYLARENAATREDNVLLVEQNAELACHQNPRQKIQVHAATRAQLAESRRAQLAVTSKLAASEAKMAQLENELQAYKSVSALPFVSSFSNVKSASRTRVHRPTLLPDQDSSPTPTATTAHAVERHDMESMPPPRLPPSKASIAFSIHTAAHDLPLSTSSWETSAFTSSLVSSRTSRREAIIADEIDAPLVDGMPRPRRLSSGGVRMTGKMSLSELI